MGTNSFIDILDSALVKTTLGTTRIYVVYYRTWTLWLHRNNRVYQDRLLRFAPCINADLAIAHLEVVAQYTTFHKKYKRMHQAMALIVPHPRVQLPTTLTTTH